MCGQMRFVTADNRDFVLILAFGHGVHTVTPNRKDTHLQERIKLYQRPELTDPGIAGRIVEIAQELAGEWFTSDVPEGVKMDLMFQDAFCFEVDGLVVSFIMFTSCDGAINLSIAGTRLSERGRGYCSRLMEHLVGHVSGLGFTRMEVFTVSPEQKPCYRETIRFYEKHGFVFEREYRDIWKSGPALKFVRNL